VVVALQMSLPLRGSSARVVLPHPRILIPIIAFDVLVPPLSARSSLDAAQPSSVLPTQTMTRPTISCPSLHMPFSICLRESELPHPSHPTSLRLSVSHPLAKYFDLVHASRSPVSARSHSVSPSRRSPLRSIYPAFLLHRPQMTPSCFMVACDLHGRRSQQMRVKPRCSRARLPVRESSCLHSIAVHSISPFRASPPM
jgi:hypothetical protein